MKRLCPGSLARRVPGNLVPRAGHQTQGGCTRARQRCRERPTGLGGCPLLGSRPTRCLGTLVSTKGNSEAVLTTLAVGLVSGVPGESLAGVTGDEGPGPGTSQALSGGAGEGSVPAGAPATAVPAASLGTVLRETHKGRSWLTMGPGHLPPGLRCPLESSAPPRGQRSARAEAGASGSLGTSVWRLRLPCLPAPPPHQGGQRPQRPRPVPVAPWPAGDTKGFRGQVASLGRLPPVGRLLQETRFSLGGLSGDSGPTGVAPLKEATGVPRPWAA